MDLFICILILFGSTVNSVSAIDCKTRPCHFHASCTDSPDPVSTGSSYTCTCNTGYEGDGKHNCIDVHICNKPDTCGPNAICLYKPGKYYCNCKEGYSHDQITNFGCIDVNECVDPNICGVNAVCKNINGSFTCGCLAGYVKDQSGICQDFDECTDLKLCPNNYQCKNTAGSYKCECQEGYELRNGCIDRDECLNKNICGLDAVCINTNGSYECKCPAGYEGDPQIRCTDIDECLKGNDCKRYNAACVNEPGTYSCVCPTGTTGNPTEQCMAIVETTTTEPREVEAIMQLREERKLKEGSAPSLNLWLSAENVVLHFSKNHNIYKDKSFKITIHVEDNIKARYKFQRLICYNKTQATQIYCNDELKIDINGDYYTEVQKALPTLEAEWKCKLKAKSHTTPEVSLSFLVGFVTSYSKLTTSSSKVDEEYDRDPGFLETGVLVAIGAAILVIIIAVIWIIVSVYKRKRRHEQTQDSDIHYENLGTGSLPTPVPWDTYSSPGDAVEPTYSEPVGHPSSNNLYAEPGANSQRQIPNEYAEINAASELDYTALEAQGPLYYSYANPQAMYSEVKPKSARGIAPQAALKPQVTYAKVAPKSQRKKSKEDTYANASAFETQQYVNVKAEQESTEPAYCEIQKIDHDLYQQPRR